LLVAIAPEGLPRLQQAGLDVRVSMFALGVAVVSAVLFGIAPALHLPPPELLTGRQTHARTRTVLRQILVSAQIAVSFVLLACAGLLLRSLWNVQNTPTGMNTENVITEQVSLPVYRYPGAAQQAALFQELEKRLKGLPGVTSLALSDSLPPAGAMRSTILAAIEVEGHAPRREGTGGMVPWRAVTPEYFSALSVPILEGRGFRPEDQQPSENPIILNQTLARALFPAEDPIGRHLRLFRTEGPWRTVVGIAANVKNNGVTEKPEPEFYLPWKNDSAISLRSAHIIVRTRMNSSAMAAWIRTETTGFDATIPVTIELMNQRVGKLAEGARFRAVLLSLFAATGVGLAAIGIYGVVGFLVAQRTREIGVRMALGANASEILRMVLANVARWTVAGAVLGLIGAWFGARLLESMLYEVRAHDPLLFGVALMILLATPLVAACVPARRAIRVSPVVALRSD
jgi:predicted permease